MATTEATKARMEKLYNEDFIRKLEEGPDAEIVKIVSVILSEQSSYQKLYPDYFQSAFMGLVQRVYETSLLDHDTTLRIYEVFLAVYSQNPPLDLMIVTSDNQRIETNKLSLMMQSLYFAEECKGKTEIQVKYTKEEMELILLAKDIPSTNSAQLVRIVEIADILQLTNKQEPALQELKRRLAAVVEGEAQEVLWTTLQGSSNQQVQKMLFLAVARVIEKQPSPFVKYDTSYSFGFILCNSRLLVLQMTDYRMRFAGLFVKTLYLDNLGSNRANLVCLALTLPLDVRKRITKVMVGDSREFDDDCQAFQSLAQVYPRVTEVNVGKSFYTREGLDRRVQFFFPQVKGVGVGYETSFQKAASYSIPESSALLGAAFAPSLVDRLHSENNLAIFIHWITMSTDIKYPDDFQRALLLKLRELILTNESLLKDTMLVLQQFDTAYQASTPDFVMHTSDGVRIDAHALPFLVHSPYFREACGERREVTLDIPVDAVQLLVRLLMLRKDEDYSHYSLNAIVMLLPHLETYKLPSNFRKTLVDKLQRRFLAAEEAEKIVIWEKIEKVLTLAERLSILSMTPEFKTLHLGQPLLEGRKFVISGAHVDIFLTTAGMVVETLIRYTDTIKISSGTLPTAYMRVLAMDPQVFKHVGVLALYVFNQEDYSLLQDFVSRLSILEIIDFNGAVFEITLQADTKAYVSLTRCETVLHTNSKGDDIEIIHADRMGRLKTRGWKIINPINFFPSEQGGNEALFYPPSGWNFDTKQTKTNRHYICATRNKEVT